MVTFRARSTILPSFSVETSSVAFAGNRHAAVPSAVARSLVHVFGSLGFSFLTGCAPGVDASFRRVLAKSAFRSKAFIACAFDSRIRRCEAKQLSAGRVVPDGLTAAAALHRRTVWMVRRSSILVLFPDDRETGRWGRGSTLAYRTARYNLKPLFVVSKHRPKPHVGFLIARATLFGIVDGYWVIPHPVREGGSCEDAW